MKLFSLTPSLPPSLPGAPQAPGAQTSDFRAHLDQANSALAPEPTQQSAPAQTDPEPAESAPERAEHALPVPAPEPAPEESPAQSLSLQAPESAWVSSVGAPVPDFPAPSPSLPQVADLSTPPAPASDAPAPPLAEPVQAAAALVSAAPERSSEPAPVAQALSIETLPSRPEASPRVEAAPGWDLTSETAPQRRPAAEVHATLPEGPTPSPTQAPLPAAPQPVAIDQALAPLAGLPSGLDREAPAGGPTAPVKTASERALSAPAGPEARMEAPADPLGEPKLRERAAPAWSAAPQPISESTPVPSAAVTEAVHQPATQHQTMAPELASAGAPPELASQPAVLHTEDLRTGDLPAPATAPTLGEVALTHDAPAGPAPAPARAPDAALGAAPQPPTSSATLSSEAPSSAPWSALTQPPAGSEQPPSSAATEALPEAPELPPRPISEGPAAAPTSAAPATLHIPAAGHQQSQTEARQPEAQAGLQEDPSRRQPAPDTDTDQEEPPLTTPQRRPAAALPEAAVALATPDGDPSPAAAGRRSAASPDRAPVTAVSPLALEPEEGATAAFGDPNPGRAELSPTPTEQQPRREQEGDQAQDGQGAWSLFAGVGAPLATAPLPAPPTAEQSTGITHEVAPPDTSAAAASIAAAPSPAVGPERTVQTAKASGPASSSPAQPAPSRPAPAQRTPALSPKAEFAEPDAHAAPLPVQVPVDAPSLQAAPSQSTPAPPTATVAAADSIRAPQPAAAAASAVQPDTPEQPSASAPQTDTPEQPQASAGPGLAPVSPQEASGAQEPAQPREATAERPTTEPAPPQTTTEPAPPQTTTEPGPPQTPTEPAPPQTTPSSDAPQNWSEAWAAAPPVPLQAAGEAAPSLSSSMPTVAGFVGSTPEGQAVSQGLFQPAPAPSPSWEISSAAPALEVPPSLWTTPELESPDVVPSPVAPAAIGDAAERIDVTTETAPSAPSQPRLTTPPLSAAPVEPPAAQAPAVAPAAVAPDATTADELPAQVPAWLARLRQSAPQRSWAPKPSETSPEEAGSSGVGFGELKPAASEATVSPALSQPRSPQAFLDRLRDADSRPSQSTSATPPPFSQLLRSQGRQSPAMLELSRSLSQHMATLETPQARPSAPSKRRADLSKHESESEVRVFGGAAAEPFDLRQEQRVQASAPSEASSMDARPSTAQLEQATSLPDELEVVLDPELSVRMSSQDQRMDVHLQGSGQALEPMVDLEGSLQDVLSEQGWSLGEFSTERRDSGQRQQQQAPNAPRAPQKRAETAPAKRAPVPRGEHINRLI